MIFFKNIYSLGLKSIHTLKEEGVKTFFRKAKKYICSKIIPCLFPSYFDLKDKEAILSYILSSLEEKSLNTTEKREKKLLFH